MNIRVYYEDTDTGGVVYHSQYLNFCERARSEVFFQQGITPALAESHFVARKVIADYISSAKLGDLLDVKTTLVKMKAASFILKQMIFKEDGSKVFEMEITLAHISLEGKPKKMDKETVALIDSFFNT